MIYKHFLFFVIITLYGNLVSAQQYVKYKVRKGENLTNIFNNYKLNKSCDLEKFKTLNKIGDPSKILAGKTYQLPIQIYSYNGKSIRTTINKYDYEVAKKIQFYNEELFKAKIKPSDYRINKKLWLPHHFFNCESKLEPVSPKKKYEIFGKNNEEVKIIDKKLKGCVYYLVSGHGGPDPGAIGKSGSHKLCEDEYAYDITLRLARELLAHSAVVYLITRDNNDGIRSGKFLDCDKDETCWKNQKIPFNQKSRLAQRVRAVNKLYAENTKKGYKYQRMVVIHVDSRQIKKRMDMFFYHYPGSKKSRNFALGLYKMIKLKYNKYQKSRGYTGTVRSRDLYMLRESKTTSAYIELGNIQNADDQKRFILESNRQAVAKWLADGLLEKK